MAELLRLASLGVFVGLGLALHRRAAGAARRRALNRFLIYVIGLSALVGVSQWDDWPFATYTLAAFRPRTETPICLVEFWAVDASGREWRLDPWTWSPLFDSTLQNWFGNQYVLLSTDGKATALRFLLARAEAARARLAAHRPIGFQRRLGAFAAPYWWMIPRATTVPATPYAGLRVYEACRVPAEMLAGSGRVRRLLRAEFPS